MISQRSLQAASWTTSRNDHYLNIYFHSWEFANLANYRLPRFVKRVDGERILEHLKRYLRWLREKGRAVTFSEFNGRFREGRARAPGSASAFSTLPEGLTDA